jgi:protein-S-isoprenylcysteine O-methyltransferase Ste14
MKLFWKNVLFTLLVPGTVAVSIPCLIVDGSSVAWGSVAAAVPLFVLGAAIYLWCLWDFATFGRGTPAPIDAPQRLVIRGLYRYIRNPMYTGILTVLLGWVVCFQTAGLVVYIVLVAGLFHLFVVLYEEPHLHRVFGSDYDGFRTRTGRWLPRGRVRE